MRLPLILLGACLAGPAVSAAAIPWLRDTTPTVLRGGDVVAGVGAAGILDEHKLAMTFLHVGLPERWHGFRPWLGFDQMEGGAFWIGAGVRLDIDVARDWVVTMSFAPGYFEDGAVLELGSSLEFASSLEIARRIGRTGRVGLAFGHYSNAGIALLNPGTEILRLFISIPLDQRG